MANFYSTTAKVETRFAGKHKYDSDIRIHVTEQAVTTIRMDRETLRLLDRMARVLHTDRSTLLRRAVHRGARAELLDEAISQYLQSHMSAGAAKEWAGVSYAEFLDELKKRGLPYLTDEEGIEKELERFEAKVKHRGGAHH